MPASAKRPRLDPIDRMTPEERFLTFGGKRPAGFGLHNAQSKEGQEARAGLFYLLAQIRKSGNYAVQATSILQSCANPGAQPLNWHDLMSLHTEYWQVTMPLLNYVWRCRGLSREDFEDDGREFSRLVFGAEPAEGAPC